jgi:hypothetical protein
MFEGFGLIPHGYRSETGEQGESARGKHRLPQYLPQ